MTGLVALLTLSVPMRAVHLRTEYLVEPLAVQTSTPRFSWEVEDSRYGAKQTAYEIKVSSAGKVVWETGKVGSSAENQVAYAGSPLASRAKCKWEVRLWDADNQPSGWASAEFRIGLLEKSDWMSKWISTPEPVPDVHPADNGYHSQVETSADKAKWVTIDLGSAKSFDAVRLWPANPFDFQPRTPGFLFPVRFAVEASDDESFAQVTNLVEMTARDVPNPKDAAVRFAVKSTSARFVRLRVTKLAERDPGHFGFALAELEVLDGRTNIAKGAKVTASDAIEDRTWSKARLVDGDTHSHGLEGLDALPVTMLRKEFALAKQVKSATLYATALGAYETSINGKRVGDHILAPEWTDYHSRVQYQAYDVTKLVKSGSNDIGVSLGDGWYAGRIGMAQALDPRGYPRAVYGRRAWFMGQLELEFADGSKKTVFSDESWQSTTQGQVRSSDIYDGETVDLGAPASPVWTNAATSEQNVPVVAQPNEPIRIVDKITPVKVTEPKPRVYVFDMGQNMVGWAHCRLKAFPGSVVTIHYAEVLNDDGTVYTDNLRGAPQVDRIMVPANKGSKSESQAIDFRPHFTYHGFRFLSVTGLSEMPKVEDVTGEVFCSSSPETATFECSDPMANKLWSNIFWTQRANLMSSPTDCPQRDERLGWMGDILAFAQNAYYNMDMAGFFTKWLQDVRDAQADDGRYPDFAPHPYGKNDRFNGVPGWGDAGVVCAWVHYKNTGDKRLLGEHFDSAKRWVDWIASKNPENLWIHDRHNDYGDWLNGNTLIRQGWDSTGGEVPKEVFATMMWFQSVRMVAQMADVLGRPEAAALHAQADKVRAAFVKAYVKPDGEINGDTQAGYALALYYGMVPQSLKEAAFKKLVAAIDKRGGVLTTGFHSTLPMMEVLSGMGRNDLAYKLLLNKEFPSWGYTIENGATTIWERWDGYVKGRGFQNPGMNSFNHWALGSVGQWMMETVGGIKPGEKGWKEIVIAPRPGPGIDWAKSTYRSHWGPIAVSWKRENGGVRVQFTVPANTTARVLLDGTVDVKEGRGHLKPQNKDIGGVWYEAESGTYDVFCRT